MKTALSMRLDLLMLKDKFNINFDDAGPTKAVFLAFIILLFHVVILLLMAFSVIFFGFIIKYFIWIFLGIGLVVAGTAFYIFHSIKRQSSGIAEVLTRPEFKGRTFELKLLGGLASMKVADTQESTPLLEYGSPKESRQLSAPDPSRVHELSELARLLENDFITQEEYDKAKKEILNE